MEPNKLYILETVQKSLYLGCQASAVGGMADQINREG